MTPNEKIGRVEIDAVVAFDGAKIKAAFDSAVKPIKFEINASVNFNESKIKEQSLAQGVIAGKAFSTGFVKESERGQRRVTAISASENEKRINLGHKWVGAQQYMEIRLTKIAEAESLKRINLFHQWEGAAKNTARKITASVAAETSKRIELERTWSYAGIKFDKDLTASVAAETSKRIELERTWRYASEAFDRRYNAQIVENMIKTREELRAIASKPIRFNITDNLAKVSNSLSAFDSTMRRTLRTTLIATTGWSVGVTAAVGAFAASSIKAFATVQQAAASASAVFAADTVSKNLDRGINSSKQFANIASGISKQVITASKSIALATLFSTSQVAEGFKALAQAGVSTTDAIMGMSTVAKFAQNESIDLATAVEELTGGINAAGLAMSSLGSLTDKFTVAANATNASAQEIAQAFANGAAPAFRAYGQTVDETILALELFAKANIRGAAAGTQAQILIREVNRGAGRAPEAFKKYGIAVGTVNGKVVPFSKTLLDLANTFEAVRKKGGPIATANLTKELGITLRSTRGLLQITPQLVKLQEAGVQRLLRNNEKAAGATARQAKVVNATIAFSFDQLKNSLENIKIAFGVGAQKPIQKFFNDLAGPGGRIASLDGRLNHLGVEFGKLVTRFSDFLKTGSAARGFHNIAEAIRITIQGVKDSAKAFTNAFSGKNSTKSFFESATLAMIQFSKFSAAILPEIAKLIGEAFKFVQDHPKASKFFAEAAVGAFLLRRAVSLLIVPLSTLGSGIKNFITFISKMRGAKEAARLLGPLESTISKIGGSLGEVGGSAESLTSLGAAASEAIPPLAIVAAVVVEITGFIKGFRKEIDLGIFKTKEFKQALIDLGPAISFLSQVAADARKAMFMPLHLLITGLETAAGIIGIIAAKTVSIVVPAMANATNSVTRFINHVKGIGGEDVAGPVNQTRVRVNNMGLAFDAIGNRARNASNAAVGFQIGFVDAMHSARVASSISSRGIMADLANVAIAAQRTATAIAAGAAASTQAIVDATNAANEVGQAGFQILPDTKEHANDLITLYGENGPLQKSLIAAGQKIDTARKAARNKKNHIKSVIDLPSFDPSVIGSSSPATFVAHQLADLNAAAQDKVAAMSIAMRARMSKQLIAKIDAAGSHGYSATRTEIELLNRAMPSVDAALEKQKSVVQGLTDKLNDLTNAQLKGTQAFSDAAFGFDQSIKKLQLQKLDLGVKGFKDDSKQIKALDDQIAKLQTKADRSNLVESLKLDPLRRKFDKVIHPIKEISFRDAMMQFRNLSASIKDQTDTTNKQEASQKRLQDTIANSSAKFADIDTVAKAANDRLNAAGEAASKAATGFSGVAKQANSAARGVRNVSRASSGLKDAGIDMAKQVGKGIAAGQSSLLKSINTVVESANQLIIADTQKSSIIMVDAYKFGFELIVNVSRGMFHAASSVLYPGIRNIGDQVGLELGFLALPDSLANISARGFGINVMSSLLDGMKSKFGDSKNLGKGTIAYYLHVTIPALIRKLKGPVAYDATILVPAGNAIMDGLERGLKSGFGTVESFLKRVGPSMEEFVPDSMFTAKTKNFMVDVAMGKTPNPDDFFKDLVPSSFPMEFNGILDPTLSFLHRSMSLADTTQMAEHLAKLFDLSVTALKYNHNQFTSSGNVSDHFLGVAADLSNGSNPTPQMDALAAALKPLYGSIFKQLIYRDHDLNQGFNVPGHMNHVHVAWLKAAGFDLSSGKIGAPSVLNIPGASPAVDSAINQAANQYKIPVALLAAIAKQESSFRPDVISFDGGYGLFQLTSGAARAGVSNLLDPLQNSLAGARYFRGLLDEFGGNVKKALIGYNAGPGAVNHPPSSTINTYVPHVLQFMEEFRRLFGGGRAAGGSMHPGKFYMTGEKGPEFVAPTNRSTVYDAKTTQRMAMIAQGDWSGHAPSYNDNRQFIIKSNATDPDAVAQIVASHSSSAMSGVSIR